MEYKSIKVTESTYKELCDVKLLPEQTMDSVIRMMIVNYVRRKVKK